MKNDLISEADAVKLLKKYSNKTAKHSYKEHSYNHVFNHVKAVQVYALQLAGKAKKKNKKVDIGFIRSAALLHDIGRFRFPPWRKDMIRHGLEGSRILKKEGLSKRYQRVCLTHLGVGLRKSDIMIQKLSLPLDIDYIPRTIEEKIICYADLRMDGDKKNNLIQQAARYETFHAGLGKRVLQFHNRIMLLIGERRAVKDIKKCGF